MNRVYYLKSEIGNYEINPDQVLCLAGGIRWNFLGFLRNFTESNIWYEKWKRELIYQIHLQVNYKSNFFYIFCKLNSVYLFLLLA